MCTGYTRAFSSSSSSSFDIIHTAAHNNTRLHKQHENMLTLLPIMMVSCSENLLNPWSSRYTLFVSSDRCEEKKSCVWKCFTIYALYQFLLFVLYYAYNLTSYKLLDVFQDTLKMHLIPQLPPLFVCSPYVSCSTQCVSKHIRADFIYFGRIFVQQCT